MVTSKPLDTAALARLLLQRRTELRLSQGQVADRATCSRAYVSRLERALVPAPTVTDLSKVASALGLSLTHLLEPDEALRETRYALDWATLQRQVETLPPPQAERVIRNFLLLAEIARAAADDGLAQQN